jgi:uncharacterized hydrophobic protein (TIGR00271 family)
MIKRVLHYFNLEGEIEDFDVIQDKIEKDIPFEGTNLWILVFAIFVASIGLNMNSTAVIIGAMLISPLMGPINGIGYSLATYNLPLFKKAIKNFSFAVLASLIASTLYFTISPVSVAHSELLARTSPTIYDVLIAFFGGLAGIVAISSKQKGNVIPGVAIATALMPPLCTAGYGLATANYNFFIGAFYLFTINTVFIALSAVVVCQLLKFPNKTIVDEVKKNKIDKWVTAVIIITTVPSIYFGYGLVQNEKFTERSKKLIEDISVFEDNYLLKSSIDANKKKLTLGFAGNLIDEKFKSKVIKKAAECNIDSSAIIFEKTLNLSNPSKIEKFENLQSEINRLNLYIHNLKEEKDSIAAIGKSLLKEINPIFTTITGCSYSNSRNYTQTGNTLVSSVIFTTSVELSETEKEKIRNWLNSRLKSNNIKVFFEKTGTE